MFAFTEERFAAAMHQCNRCFRWIDEEPFTRTIVANEVGGLDIYIDCRDCRRPKTYAA